MRVSWIAWLPHPPLHPHKEGGPRTPTGSGFLGIREAVSALPQPVDQRADLPGVGANLIDHPEVPISARVTVYWPGGGVEGWTLSAGDHDLVQGQAP